MLELYLHSNVSQLLIVDFEFSVLLIMCSVCNQSGCIMYVIMSIIDMLIKCSCRFHYGIRKLVAGLMGLYCGIIMSSVSRLIS